MFPGAFINGKERQGEGKPWSLINPATQEVIAEMNFSSLSQVEEAVEAALKAFKGWSRLSVEKRARIVEDASKLLRKRSMDIAVKEVENSGATLRKALGDVNLAVFHMLAFSKLAREIAVKPIEPEETFFTGFSYVRREPVGLCAAIVPWNFPLLMAVWKVVPAILMGNAVILKPAPETPVTAFEFVKLLMEAGVPEGVVNIVTGDASVGKALVMNPCVRKISFTGSTAVGKEIMKLASASVKRLTLELGGKNAFIVLDDADLSIAVDGAVFANFFHAGQVCTSGSRVLVQERIYQEFLERVVERVQSIKVGDPMDMGTGMGPLISASHRDKVLNYVKAGLKEGARLLCGGYIPEGLSRGYFLTPAVFSDVDVESTIFKEEIFGPVMCVRKFSTEEEAVKVANDTSYGLAASVWSSNPARASSIVRQLEAGTVWINEHHILNPMAPFGGYKESGLGRELGESGLLEYTEEKHVFTSLVADRSRRIWYDMLF